MASPSSASPPPVSRSGGEASFSPSSWWSSGQCRPETGMADVELDAARALADLAGIAAMEAEFDRCGTRDPESSAAAAAATATSSRKRSNSESPVRVQERSFLDPESPKSEVISVTGSAWNLGACLGACNYEDYTIKGDIITEEKVSIKEDSEALNLSIGLPSSHTVAFGSRGKQNLTEAEKEARKLRRILANRESARQTIRRREAFRMELTRKVAVLSLENENMKMEKELRTREYLSLKDTNKQLKEQIAKADERSANNTSSRELESSAISSTASSFLVYERSPFVPYFCPSWPSTYPNSSVLSELAYSSNASGLARPPYVSPCAWYYPCVHGLPESFSENPLTHGDKDDIDGDRWQEVVAVANRDKVHCCKVDGRSGAKRENSRTCIEPVPERSYKDSLVMKPSLEEFDRMIPARDDKGKLHQEQASPEKLQCTSINRLKKLVTAAKAAEARKRRKELTKLKHFHGR